MDFGTYSSATAGIAALRRLEVVTHNLSNVNTPGFKRQFVTQETQRFDKTLSEQMNSIDPTAKPDHDRYGGVSQFQTFVDFSQGTLKQTGNPLDVALRNPNDFFSVQTPQGIRYTRAGNLTLSENGELVFPDGAPIVGDGGPITVNGSSVTINPNGSVAVDGSIIGQLQVTRFSEPAGLKPEGASRFSLMQSQGGETVEPEVVPGSLEMSNVGVIPSIVELITVNRAFDIYGRAAKTIDDMNNGAINQLGKSR